MQFEERKLKTWIVQDLSQFSHHFKQLFLKSATKQVLKNFQNTTHISNLSTTLIVLSLSSVVSTTPTAPSTNTMTTSPPDHPIHSDSCLRSTWAHRAWLACGCTMHGADLSSKGNKILSSSTIGTTYSKSMNTQ